MKRLLARLSSLGRSALASLSSPPRLLAFLLLLSFGISLLSWALTDRLTSYALYFPRREGRGLGAELRELPRRRGAEARAELLASELLLGPLDPSLEPAFPPGVRVSSILLRRGTLYLDLSEEAALAGRESIEGGRAALERSLSLGLKPSRRLVLTIGGREPYADSAPAEPAEGSQAPEGKKEQKN